MYLVGKGFINLLSRIFFKEIHIEGEVPQEGPILFYTSHMNCYLDTYPVISSCPYKVSILLAAVSAKQKVVGTIARMLGCIVANRPVDSSFKGTGKVYSKGNKLIGENTGFMNELKPCRIVEVNGKEVTVLSIESDNEATCSGEVCKEASEFKIQPQLDHSEMFSSVFQELENGKAVSMMPEGRSHENPGIIKFKSGIGKIILTALDKNIPLKVYAIGVCYTFPERRRNNVTMKISKPIIFKKETLPPDTRQATKHIVSTLENELQEQVLCLDNYQEVKFVYLAFNFLYGKAFKNEKMLKWQNLGSKLTNLKKNNETRYKEIIETFLKYQEETSNLGISKYFKESVNIVEFIISFILMLFLLSITVPGLSFIWFGRFYIEYKVETARRNLLKNISFRKSGADTINSNRTIYILAFHPCLLLLLSTLFYFYTFSVISAILFFFLFPTYQIISIKLHDRTIKCLKIVKQYLLSSQTVSHLIKSRKTLQAIVQDIFS